MKFRFQNHELEELYYYERGGGGYPKQVVTAFFKKMGIIKGADNENDLRAIKGNHFEKLKGSKNKYSIRLNDQYRLIFAMDKDGGCSVLLIHEISNHYN
jgi:proteic killer suppression protein